MKFPDKPTCHDHPRLPLEWKRRTLQGRIADDIPAPPAPDAPTPFRQCSYCGSIHPEDLLAALAGGASLGGADWKYGWPHKFYVSAIPNPTPDVPVLLSYRSGGLDAHGKPLGVRDVEWRAAGVLSGKWYNEHLADDGFDDEARAAIFAALKLHAGIEFTIDAKGVHYRAPSHGYQR